MSTASYELLHRIDLGHISREYIPLKGIPLGVYHESQYHLLTMRLSFFRYAKGRKLTSKAYEIGRAQIIINEVIALRVLLISLLKKKILNSRFILMYL
jgi:hypothetical protein